MLTQLRHPGRTLGALSRHRHTVRTLGTALCVLLALVLAACPAVGAADVLPSTSLVTNYQRVCPSPPLPSLPR